MLIRKAISQDIPYIVNHNLLMALETESKKLDEYTVQQAVKAVIADSSKGFYLVAEKEDNKVIGNLMITYEWSDWRNTTIWWIQSVYVREAYRREGVFKKLYYYTIELAKKENIKLIRLYVEKDNVDAQNTYEKLGMVSSHYLLFEASI